jgi:ribosome-associated translation inhibitor RaiA
MRLHIEGQHTWLAPHLVGWIADRLEALNTPDKDIHEARVTFGRQRRREVVRIQLVLVGKNLQVTQRGETPDAAIRAALQMIQRALHNARAARRARVSMPMAPEVGRFYGPSAAGDA